MASISARSNGTKWKDSGWSRSASSIADVSCGVSFRATAMARYPTPVNRRAMARPSPRLPPVTRTLRIVPHQLAGRSDVQGRDDGDRGRNLVRRQRVATMLQDLLLEAGGSSVDGVGPRGQHHVGHDQGAQERVVSRPDPRHPHPWVAIDHRLDLFGMDFQAAHVDDATPSADEVIAACMRLDHLASVDEALRVREALGRVAQVAERGARGADPKRAPLDPQLHGGVSLPDQARREARETIAG